MKAISVILIFSFYVVGGIYHIWTILIAFEHSLLAGLCTVIFPVISNIYWLFKMSGNPLYVRFAVATIILAIISRIISKASYD